VTINDFRPMRDGQPENFDRRIENEVGGVSNARNAAGGDPSTLPLLLERPREAS